MSVGSILARGRAAHLQLMRDTVTITRVTGQTYNSTTMQYESTVSTLYTGPAQVKRRDVGDQEVQAGEREVALRAFVVKLPWTVVAVFARGDLCTVGASEHVGLVGRVLTVLGDAGDGGDTERRLAAEDRS